MTSLNAKPFPMSWDDALKSLDRTPEGRALARQCYYDDPIGEAAARFMASAEWKEILSRLPKLRGRVLDLGAGRGILAHALAKSGWEVSALEPCPGPVAGREAIARLCRETGVKIQIIEGEGEAIAAADGAFDCVVGRAILHHAKDLSLLCREAFRVLRPGGRLMIFQEHVISRDEDLPAFLESHALHSLYGGEHAYRLDVYLESLRSAGFVIDRILNPCESDINLCPGTKADVRKAIVGGISRRTGIPTALLPRWLVPPFLLKWSGEKNSTPGRRYSFLARKG